MPSSMHRLNSRWATWSRPKRLVVFLASFALVFGATVVVLATVDKANAATAARKICQPGGNPDLQCLTPPQLVDKFKDGKLGRQSGFTAADYFKNPLEFRQDAHDQIEIWLGNHPTAEGQLRAKYLTKRRDPGCTDNCLAWKIYADIVGSSNCGPAIPLSVDPTTCEGFPTGHQKAVERGITVAYCGGAVILGALGVFSTDGVAAPAVASIYGGIGCAWGFMDSFFH